MEWGNNEFVLNTYQVWIGGDVRELHLVRYREANKFSIPLFISHFPPKKLNHIKKSPAICRTFFIHFLE